LSETNANRWVTNFIFAQMRPISGPLAEQPASVIARPAPDAATAATHFDTVFRYIVFAELSPAMPLSADSGTGSDRGRLRNLTNDLFELRLTYQWPVLRQNTEIYQPGKLPEVGPNRKTFRTLLAGRLEKRFIRNSNNQQVVAEIPGDNPARVPLREFKPSLFVHTPAL